MHVIRARSSSGSGPAGHADLLWGHQRGHQGGMNGWIGRTGRARRLLLDLLGEEPLGLGARPPPELCGPPRPSSRSRAWKPGRRARAAGVVRLRQGLVSATALAVLLLAPLPCLAEGPLGLRGRARGRA